ncbi:endo-1,4-beta-xylanase [Mesorhizobium sp. VNQ89]|uniref:endo-1,4-beta-xylanase n=1 Tax=Mesorhizobium quangtriensis TaxID=3157709 RepID=UPI0032B80D4D
MSKSSLDDTLKTGGPSGGDLPALKTLGKKRGLEIGTAYTDNADPAYRRLLAYHSDLIVPQWQLKPRFLKPHKNSPYNFGPCDSIYAFAAKNRMAFHGHTLFWHEEPIRWAESGDFQEASATYGEFIREVVRHYPKAVSWDVFNEIVEENQPFRDEPLIQRYGLQFIDFCLRTTHEAAPRARLALNEYNLECAMDWCRSKQANMTRLLRDLKRMGSPVHAVGIQAHLSTVHRASPRATLDMINAIADLGLDVYISELDVNDSTLPRDIAERDRLVAEYYEEFLTPVLAHRAVKRLVFWGISDFDNWVVQGYTTEKRKAGTGAARPALFDAENQPKPAFHAVVRALSAAPSRTS